MNADIQTIDEVDAGKYTVRVGHAEEGYAATVIDAGGSSMPNPRTVGGMLAMMHTDSGDESDDVAAPAVTAPHKWVSVGLAIEAYQWREAGGQIDTDEGSVYDGASMVVDGEEVGDVRDVTLSADDQREKLDRDIGDIANMTLGEVLQG